jgi:DNA polymerase-1
MKTALLIDGDIIAYKHAAGSEVPTDWGNDFWTLHTDVKQASHQMEIDIKELVVRLKADKTVIALSDKENFRRRIDETYKASRKKSRKPMGLPSLRQCLLDKWDAVLVPELEADDILGIWATDEEYLPNYRKIIISIDKDMKTLPCELYNPSKTELGVQKITLESADRFHLFQTLVGDSTDGYPGCPAIGPARAERLLDECCSWKTVVGAFKKADLTEEDALQQARLAKILRTSNYDWKNGTIKHWNPPHENHSTERKEEER